MAVEAFSSSAGLTAVKAGTTSRVVTTDGAGGRIDMTLPGASQEAGAVFEFVNTTGASGLRVYPFGSDSIRVEGSVTSAGGYISSSAEGDAIRLQCLGAGRWVCMCKVGTWTVV